MSDEILYTYVRGKGWITAGNAFNIDLLDTYDFQSPWFTGPDGRYRYPHFMQSWHFIASIDSAELRIGDYIPFLGKGYFVLGPSSIRAIRMPDRINPTVDNIEPVQTYRLIGEWRCVMRPPG